MADQAGTQHGHWGPYATHRHMQQPHFTTQSEFGSYWPNNPGVSQNQNPHLSTLAYKMEEMQQTLDKLTENFTTENDKVLLQGRLEETEKQLTEKKQEVVSLQETLKERSNEAILSAMDYILRVLKKNNDNMKKKRIENYQNIYTACRQVVSNADSAAATIYYHKLKESSDRIQPRTDGPPVKQEDIYKLKEVLNAFMSVGPSNSILSQLLHNVETVCTEENTFNADQFLQLLANDTSLRSSNPNNTISPADSNPKMPPSDANRGADLTNPNNAHAFPLHKKTRPVP